jgi:hypothetical protein
MQPVQRVTGPIRSDCPVHGGISYAESFLVLGSAANRTAAGQDQPVCGGESRNVCWASNVRLEAAVLHAASLQDGPDVMTMWERMLAALVLLLAIASRRQDKQWPPPTMTTSGDETRPTKGRFERVLAGLNVATSIATVAVLIATVLILVWTYKALQDSNAQLALSRQDLTNAREAAQPTFQLTFYGQQGAQCIYGLSECDRIAIKQAGTAEEVDYSVSESLLFTAGPMDDYYLSPTLDNWQPSDDPNVWTPSGPSRLPRDLAKYSLHNNVSLVYIIDVSYTDAFGAEQEKEWIQSDQAGLIELQGSMLDECDQGMSNYLSPGDTTNFEIMISSPYTVADLNEYSKALSSRIFFNCFQVQ